MLKSSIERPAWVSMPEHGGLNAYKHRHGTHGVEEHYYGHTIGFKTRRDAAELREDTK